MKVSEFMLALNKDMIEKRNLSEKTANNYIKCLYKLNDEKPFNSFSFLRDTEAVDAKLKDYSENTKKTYYSCLSSVLGEHKSKPTYKKAYNHYYSFMMDKSKEHREAEATHEKTDKQKENWLDWNEIQTKKEEIHKEVMEFINTKQITERQYDKLLQYTILSIYTDLQPRRNQDIQEMWLVGQYNDNMDKNKNYLDFAGQRFIYNVYKTAKKYGQQIVEFKDNEAIKHTLQMYLKHHPLNKGKITKATEFRFLVYYDGSGLTANNAITRIFNKIFGKNAGSSILRHSYLSSKYGDIIEEQQKDAEAMGHSVAEQRDYVKK
jgi:hypothetical protein